MQTDPSSSYPARVRAWSHAHRDDTNLRAQLDQHAEIVTILLSLDLEPARSILARCYASSPRGGDPWDPIVLLRCLLIALIAGIPSINKLVPALRGSRVLRVLAGLPDTVADGENTAPGVGTLYDFLHRVHDGPLPRGVVGYIRPSQVERQATRAPRRPGNEGRRSKEHKGRTAAEEATPDGKPSERTLQTLRQTRTARRPDDLLGRMSELLWVLAVRPSAERGLLGDLQNLVVAGDGSPLVTGACGLGQRACRCDRTKTCDCPRTFADPDARSGWDSYRRHYFYGHHFYEICVPYEHHDLPVLLRLDPANTSDHVAGLLALDGLSKTLRDETDGWRIDRFIADCGHDGSATYALCDDLYVRPVIPLNGAPALHPKRPDLKLSPKGIPLCLASVELAAWGSSEPGRPTYICPVKARKIATCPLAPKDEPTWLCEPGTPTSPVVNLAKQDDPRLFPEIHRNSKTFEDTYRLRTGCERSNGLKKGRFQLERARHRRASFWLIRLHLIAILQHAMAWTSGADPRAVVRELLGPMPPPTG
jgi:hypothetical protein